MVKSSRIELAALREEVFERDDWSCVWPGCKVDRFWDGWVHGNADKIGDQLQLAHLVHRGMGGSKYANRPDNCVTLCAVHHDCLDGRTSLGTLRWELNEMLRSLVS